MLCVSEGLRALLRASYVGFASDEARTAQAQRRRWSNGGIRP
jgi:hypothetical protein